MKKLSQPRLTIRFTEQEYALLQAKAAGRPLSGFARELLLKGAAAKRKAKRPHSDAQALAQALALLGSDPRVSLLRSFRAAHHDGVIDLEDADVEALKTALRQLSAIRSLLLTALRVQS